MDIREIQQRLPWLDQTMPPDVADDPVGEQLRAATTLEATAALLAPVIGSLVASGRLLDHILPVEHPARPLILDILQPPSR